MICLPFLTAGLFVAFFGRRLGLAYAERVDAIMFCLFIAVCLAIYSVL